ncbi:hypothetical protein F4776DRAFT_270001 [Hypoxylon sp. NC0597]|nr:hypothetical protein F4776DRAFT_270001 [Hypoxylon sp. NC0597]
MMATKQSRQLRKAYCRRARQRDPTLTSFFARGAKGSGGQYKTQDDMPSTTTFNTRYLRNRNNNDYGRTSQPTIPPQTPVPIRPLNLATFTQPRSLQPATRSEIYGLAFGTCLLLLLTGSLLLVAIRASFGFFARKSDKMKQETDPEIGLTLEIPEQSRSFLSKLRAMSAEELIKSARRKSIDVATGIKRDIGEFGRLNHYERYRVDEEAGLNKVERRGVDAGGPFLRKRRTVEGA